MNQKLDSELSELLKNFKSAAEQGKLEEMFDYDPAKKKYKLKGRYTLSDSAIEQRRKAAKRPRRRNRDELISFCDVLIEALMTFKNNSQKAGDPNAGK